VLGGLGFAGFAWVRVLPVMMLMGAIAGFGLILYVASTNVLIQMTTADEFRGRVMSLYTLMFLGTAPFGALLAGAIAQRFGAPVATSACALVLLGGALWVSVRLRAIAARERQVEPAVRGHGRGAVAAGRPGGLPASCRRSPDAPAGGRWPRISRQVRDTTRLRRPLPQCRASIAAHSTRPVGRVPDSSSPGDPPVRTGRWDEWSR